MNWSPLNVLLQILAGFLFVAGSAAWLVARRGHHEGQTRALGLGVAALVAVYFLAVFTVSLRSREVVLSRGETKHFCGFYLDCHLSVTVDSVYREPQPAGERYHVGLRFASDARREPLTLHRPGITLIGADGRTFQPQASVNPATISQQIVPGGSYQLDVAFDVPAGTTNPRLLVTELEGVWPDKAFELFLIGNEKSVLHKKVLLAL